MRVSPGIFLLLSFTLAGCVSQGKVETESTAPKITAAKFQLGQPNTVVIKGEFFKIKSDNKKDVVVSLGNNRWEPARKIIDSTPTTYTAELPYGINFPEVWVRVYGLNSEYSEPFLVHGQE